MDVTPFHANACAHCTDGTQKVYCAEKAAGHAHRMQWHPARTIIQKGTHLCNLELSSIFILTLLILLRSSVLFFAPWVSLLVAPLICFLIVPSFNLYPVTFLLPSLHHFFLSYFSLSISSPFLSFLCSTICFSNISILRAYFLHFENIKVGAHNVTLLYVSLCTRP